MVNCMIEANPFVDLAYPLIFFFGEETQYQTMTNPTILFGHLIFGIVIVKKRT